MKTNAAVCEGMNPSEIVQFVTIKYSNLNSRSTALAKLKTHFQKTKDSEFCKQLHLSYSEYRQIRSHREQRNRMRRVKPPSDVEMLFYANEIIQQSKIPGRLLPCLVLLTGIKPSSLLKKPLKFPLPDLWQEKLEICKARWPCDNLTLLEMHKHYQSSWHYHLRRTFPNFTFNQLCGF